MSSTKSRWLSMIILLKLMVEVALPDVSFVRGPSIVNSCRHCALVVNAIVCGEADCSSQWCDYKSSRSV